MNYMEKKIHVGQPEYDTHFWSAMRGNAGSYNKLELGRIPATGAYLMPGASSTKCMNALGKESLFRQIGTVVKVYGNGYKILAKDCDDLAMWVPEGGDIPLRDGMTDFAVNALQSWKLATFIKMDEAFVHDAAFNVEDYLVERLARNFGEAEEQAFINGTGVEMPTGILADAGGAKVGVATGALTYDDVIRLYFSVKPRYRKRGVWLMNDETALVLRTLKDADGNYLWRQSDDTILGKNVIISEYMPNTVAGSKPIAFGDFSYYWVVGRAPISVRSLIEEYTLYDQIGYLAFEFLDGKLIRPEAIKVIQMTE